MLQHPRLRDILSPHEQPLTVRLQLSLRNRADFFGKVPGDMDEIPTPISVVRHKPTWSKEASLRKTPRAGDRFGRHLWRGISLPTTEDDVSRARSPISQEPDKF
ncbi:hypothetical protein E2C01_055526 [Portunus trituberculatus]|uniref:Uncharacterized protein n=1 Tax=Portunus trituberculatus TaxID=210409 RepID=A0A5B7GUZ8_PORTR|nr:hypothetical protein [Portunus trituberculatus]